MALYIQKFGGTSVGSIERLHAVADRICKQTSTGDQIVVVVSAMSGETNRLVELGHNMSDAVSPREMDVLLSSGEQVSAALLSMALIGRGCPARSYLASQIHIKTDSNFTRARIEHVESVRLQQDLSAGIVPVVTGFQGMDNSGNITTLGRGGSDTTAVALGVALKADECQIYTDVDGVYTADPRVVEGARRLPTITFEEMLELASLGAKVLHPRAVEFAGKYGVPLRVLSSFNDDQENPGSALTQGTLITMEEKSMEQPEVSGIAFSRDEAKITLQGVPDVPGIASRILGPVSESSIDVDMIVQNVGADGTTDFTFTVKRSDYDATLELLRPVRDALGARELSGDNRIAKVSVVGVGMRSHTGVATRMFDALAGESINIQMITTSEIKISVVVAERYLELAVRSMHRAFSLSDQAVSEE